MLALLPVDVVLLECVDLPLVDQFFQRTLLRAKLAPPQAEHVFNEASPVWTPARS